MELRFRKGSRDYIRTLAPEPKKGIRRALRLLSEDVRHPELDVKQLRKRADFLYYRIRVGDYRIVCSPRGQVVHTWRIMHRSEGYDWLDHFDP